MQAIRSVLVEDGVRGFWRGTVMRLSRTVFSGGESSLGFTLLIENEVEEEFRPRKETNKC